MSSPDISVVITTYERSDYVKRAIQSVLKQTIKPIEIIVVEDGGFTDLSGWLSELNEPAIRYIRHEKNCGLSAARNTGFRASAGLLIAYIDDDDEWLPTRLEEQVSLYQSLTESEKAKLGCIQVGCQFLNTDGQVFSVGIPVNKGNLENSIKQAGIVTHSSCFLFTRWALENVKGFDENLVSCIDHDIWMKLAEGGFSNEFVPKPLVSVYLDERATMMTNTKQRIAGTLKYVDKWKPVYKKWFGEAGAKKFATKYLIFVIGSLAGVKFASNHFKDGMKASSLILKHAGFSAALLSLSVSQVFKVYVYYAFPSLSRLKRKLFSKK